ncbi:excalibur calcium-binding domain-containing protein [Bifidobacterium indicum]|uniref:excalibur calcium-binding domain-containing protein n=1 Tax=Bifidobacterium indicum TaxID=1691 RepID=UPI0030D8B989
MPVPNGEDQGNAGGRRRGKGKKKPWYKRTWVWIVVAVVLILGLAFGQGGSKEASAPASSKSTQPAVSQPAKETFDMQTLVGRKWDEASRTLTDHHWTTTDYTVQTDDGKTPILDSNWTVTGVSADTKPVISLRHDTATQPAPAPAQSAAPAPTQEPTQEQAPAQAPAPAPAPDTYEYYQNCDAVRAAGKAPLYQGQPGYRPALDRDHDGVACE